MIIYGKFKSLQDKKPLPRHCRDGDAAGADIRTEHKRSHAALPAQRAERIALWRDCRRTAPVALKHVEGYSGNGKGCFRQTAQRQGGQPPTVFQADERRRENAGGHTLLRRLHTGNNKKRYKGTIKTT